MAREPWVHASAEIEPGARVGAGTRVWRQAHVRTGAVIGEDCTIAARVYVDAGARVGNRVKIQDNVSVYAGVELEDDVFVGPAAVFTNDRNPRAYGDWELGWTRVRRGASIGANATVVCGVDIGEGAMVAAGAVVIHDVEPYELVAGNPARRRGWVCSCGHVLVHTAEARPSSWRCSRCGRSEGEAAPAAGPPRPPAITLHRVRVEPEGERLVRQVLRSGQLAQGPIVDRFERAWASAVGVRHAMATSSGTSALLLALRASGVGPGDEVVTSPLTFSATVSTVVEAGAIARFADVGADGMIDPAGLEAVISGRTRAVVPVHLYGMPADLPRIATIARRHSLALVEDAAQAAGARFGERAVGAFGTGCFSFYATKNLTTGEGGMVTTDDDEVAEHVRRLRNHGRGPGGDHVAVGHNFRMTDLQAALGIAQLGALEDQNERRRRNAACLSQGLAGLPGLVPPPEIDGRTPVYSLYTVRVTADARLTRDALADHLARHGVESGVYYRRLVFDHPAFRNHPQVRADPVDRAKAMVDEVLSLPVHPYLTVADVERVVEVVRHALS